MDEMFSVAFERCWFSNFDDRNATIIVSTDFCDAHTIAFNFFVELFKNYQRYDEFEWSTFDAIDWLNEKIDSAHLSGSGLMVYECRYFPRHLASYLSD
jgi:hypothetical protein